MPLRDVLYGLYGRRLAAAVGARPLPRHVGVIVDGNRRFAAERGQRPAQGHAAGAQKIEEFLDWCWELQIPYVTLWLLSTDNLDRDDREVAALLRIIEGLVTRIAWHPTSPERGLRVTALGALDLLPAETARVLKEAEEATADHDRFFLQVAVGYGGRREIVDALRSLLEEADARGASPGEVAAGLTVDSLNPHLYAKDLPEPDLIIRTSGEVRMSGFLLWQSAHSEFYFCDPYWPAFRRIDFLRAVRDYQRRRRRYGR